MNQKICLVIHSLQPGGAERVMSELANYFARRSEVEVHLILYGIKRDVFYSLLPSIIIHTPSFEFKNNKRLWSTIKTMVFLRTKIQEIDPLAVLSFGEYWNSFVLLATRGLKYPVYVSDRCQPNKPLSKVHELLRKWLYPFATGVIAQTEKAKHIFESLYRHHNIQVIGNPVRSIESDHPVERENIVLTVGRLINSKHHDEMIRLFARLNKPDWKLVIVGDDALKQQNRVRLQQLIDELEISNRVELAGNQSDVEQFYLKSKVFAFTSSSEGFPNVIAEAMSAGLPVVAFDCVAGPSDMIEHNKNGYLIPLFDYTTFESHLRNLIEDEQLRSHLGQNAKVFIKRFSVDKIGLQVEKFLLPN